MAGLTAAFSLGMRHGGREDPTETCVFQDAQGRDRRRGARGHRDRVTPPSRRAAKLREEIEYVYAGTERLKLELTKRRFALTRNPEAYVFGSESGKPVKAFSRMWRDLFKVAGLD
jgi:hypothetical protein